MNRLPLTLIAVGLAAASCGGDSTPSADSGSVAPTEAPVESAPSDTEPAVAANTTVAPEPTTTEAAAPGAATSLEDVRSRVVRIVGTGTFADPAGGVQANVPGSGTGFIIDESGLAVTNNHVVTGSALLEVYVDDEPSPRNARVVAVSECSDLAVIDIDGDGYDYLDWYDGSPSAGMEIFAAGFPLGDSEYTVLDGIISKENAAGDTSWASVDAVIEHSADTLPGNSGGPIVTSAGQVIAVNYAGNDLGQSFAIGLDVARPVVDTLADGTDLDAIGVNGEALFDGENSGVWVYSVESGSAADNAGIRAGDLLLSMEAVTLADDGTMADYCDILRSHLPTDVLTVEVYRSDTDELLEGQLNGRPLEVVTSFETQFDDVAADDPTGFEYETYVPITDESSLIEVSVPAEWADIDRRGWSSPLATGVDEIIGPALSASPSIESFTNTWGTPGVFIGASPLITTSIDDLLDSSDFTADCLYDGRYSYDDGLYTGAYDFYTDCGPEGSVFFQVYVEPADQLWVASVQIVAVTDADLVAADNVFNTFFVSDLAG